MLSNGKFCFVEKKCVERGTMRFCLKSKKLKKVFKVSWITYDIAISGLNVSS